MDDYWLSEAITNNAAWCEAVADSHGVTTSWSEPAWVSSQPMPPLYPNIVTLSRGSDIQKQIGDIDPLLPMGWGIKDSYKEHQLAGLGFKVAFVASWYCRPPTENTRENTGSNERVLSVATNPDLELWANAWGEKAGVFRPALLSNDSVELLYVEKDGQIVSGLATNCSGKSVGISNAFGTPAGILACIWAVVSKHPKKGIVGYGGNDEVTALAIFGFQAIGDLQIWLRR